MLPAFHIYYSYINVIALFLLLFIRLQQGSSFPHSIIIHDFFQQVLFLCINIHFQSFLKHLVNIGVFSHKGHGCTHIHYIQEKWQSPTGFRLLRIEQTIKCKTYPLPCATDILNKCTGYMFFSKIDILLQI